MKIQSLLLALVLVLSLVLPVSAAGTDGPALRLEAQFGSDDVTVLVCLDGAAGVTNGRAVVRFGENALLTDVKTLAQCGASSVSTENGTVSLAWVGSDLEASAELMALTFRAEGEVAVQAEISELYSGAESLAAAGAGLSVDTTPFADIDGHWAEAEIVALYNAGLINGVGNGHFDPEGELDRAAFLTMLHRMAGAPEASVRTTEFADVPADSYYASAVYWAVEQGITNGVSQSLFAPGKQINRQEMMTMLWRYAKNVEGRDVSAAEDLGAFTDGAQVAAWAEEAMSWALAEQILTGYPDGSVRPETAAVRAQAAAIFCRYLAL